MGKVCLRVGLATLIAVGVSIAGADDARESSASESFVPGYLPSGPVARPLERLDRGVVAVRSSDTEVLVSWRLLGLDPKTLAFDVERATDGGPYRKLNNKLLTGGTNFVDATADLSKSNAYRVRPALGLVKLPASPAFTLPANNAIEPVVRVPLRAGPPIKFVWVGDLDGDGAYDYVLDRQAVPQRVEAYRSDGTFLWEVNLGPNSTNQNNIEGGSSTVNVGHNDGVTVYDLDLDGRAEVAIRVANGVIFGDGSTHTEIDNIHQSIAILDGRTGAPKAKAPVPDDHIVDGPMYARFGVGYLDGVHPSLVAYMKNRVGNRGFNLQFTAWKYDGQALTQQWKFDRDENGSDLPDGHNTRIADVNGTARTNLVRSGSCSTAMVPCATPSPRRASFTETDGSLPTSTPHGRDWKAMVFSRTTQRVCSIITTTPTLAT